MELTLFIIIGAVAVMSAAMMLVSENAVHSALFLILNFACIAFFFLMLNAPFLAMVQISVYAGAIMVLFLFVIMLLGAERLLPDEHDRQFRWFIPVAVALALVFLVAVGIAIIRGEVDLTQPRPIEARIRVVHVLNEVPEIDVYLNDRLLAEGLRFRENTDFEQWEQGRYTVTVLPGGADQAAEPLAEQVVELDAGELITLAAVGLPAKARVVVAPEEIDASGDHRELHVVAVNALYDRAAVDVLDVTDKDRKQVLVEGLAYGEASRPLAIERGTYSLGVFPAGDRVTRLAEIKDQELEPETSMLWIFADQRQPDNSWINVNISLETQTNPSFGGPTHVGQLLFSAYVLPFEMVALLLLAAMVGAIVLTHEASTARRRLMRRLANPPVELDQAAKAERGD